VTLGILFERRLTRTASINFIAFAFNDERNDDELVEVNRTMIETYWTRNNGAVQVVMWAREVITI
jgi:hypothetical protein